uniref:Glycoprotein 25l n=1 Tax=Echinococcus granulosus TaxID=6210 RepID=A0A068W756_ECHGR|nr:glycoprotein 25l [Echinococcus granulosus]
MSCFQNDVASNVLTRVSYKMELLSAKSKNKEAENGPQLQVEVYDPMLSLILSREYTDSGKVYYTSDQPGIHRICISITTRFKNKKAQVKTLLDIQNIGAANYTALGLVEKYTNVQLEVRRALDSLDLITRWHDYMVKREQRFRQTTNAINWKIFVVGILQILLLLALGYWQRKNLFNLSVLAPRIALTLCALKQFVLHFHSLTKLTYFISI